MRFIHASCLKHWFSQKRQVKHYKVVTTYYWKNLECELCKQPFPYQVLTPDKLDWMNVIEYDIPEPAPGEDMYCIVLEAVSSSNNKIIHVIDMRNNIKMYLGRGNEAQIRITDISVSREHAVFIKSISGYFWLTDNDSKFGTLALCKYPITLSTKYPDVIQIGRTILFIEVSKTYGTLVKQCCSASKVPKQMRYYDNFSIVTNNGINFFPSEFVTQDYFDVWYLRREPRSKNQALMQDENNATNNKALEDETERQSTSQQRIFFGNEMSKGGKSSTKRSRVLSAKEETPLSARNMAQKPLVVN